MLGPWIPRSLGAASRPNTTRRPAGLLAGVCAYAAALPKWIRRGGDDCNGGGRVSQDPGEKRTESVQLGANLHRRMRNKGRYLTVSVSKIIKGSCAHFPLWIQGQKPGARS